LPFPLLRNSGSTTAGGSTAKAARSVDSRSHRTPRRSSYSVLSRKRPKSASPWFIFDQQDMSDGLLTVPPVGVVQDRPNITNSASLVPRLFSMCSLLNTHHYYSVRFRLPIDRMVARQFCVVLTADYGVRYQWLSSSGAIREWSSGGESSCLPKISKLSRPCPEIRHNCRAASHLRY
jgi:hypothetical protein